MASIPIFDQGNLGSCTANAICFLKMYLDHIENTQAGGYFHHLSRLYLYWHERNLEGTTFYDSGAYIRDGFKVLNQRGCAGESFFPYDVFSYIDTPTAEAEENAELHKISGYYRVYLPQLKSVLAEGYPVVLGIDVYERFEGLMAAVYGIIPMPEPGERLLGGHAVVAVGYNADYVICRNSWGEQWGDNGYFYLPWAYFDSYVHDMWTGK
jgi:C1A family cysteine protease